MVYFIFVPETTSELFSDERESWVLALHLWTLVLVLRKKTQDQG